MDYLGGFSSEYLTDQMIDAIFVDIDRENKNPHKKFDNEITEDEFCTKLSQLNPFFDVNSPAVSHHFLPFPLYTCMTMTAEWS